jgi:HEPN domain-containing protein
MEPLSAERRDGPCQRSNESLVERLSAYKLPEDKADQQRFIDRAEEDLLCAVSLCRGGARGYLPLVTVCYLLHQAIEKWLKLLISVLSIGVSTKGTNAHNLRLFLTEIGKLEPEFLSIQDNIEVVDGEMLEHRFPGDLRYKETPSEIDLYIKVLLKAAFTTRRLVKRHLKKEAT